MVSWRAKPNCYDTDSDLIPVKEARDQILRNVLPIRESELVSISAAAGRVLFENIDSPMDVPPHRNAAMDGFAVAGQQIPDRHATTFQVVGTSWAGAPFTGAVGASQAVHIMTGAVMPDDTDTVVPQEHVETIDDEHVRIGPGHPLGINVRAAGEDITRGQTVLTAGTRIGPAESGVLASLGIAQVSVGRRISVAVMSTGNELRGAGQALESGALYDSNRFTLMHMLARLGTDVADFGIHEDKPGDLLKSLHQAARGHDVIITSGGVSTGAADYVLDVASKIGDLQVWRIAIRPGRPFAQGRIGDALFFGLPGNPVAVMVTYYQLVEPALRRLLGETNVEPVPILQARTVSRFRKKPGRTEVYRAILSRDAKGQPTVRSTGQQGSGLLHSMSVANCFVILGDEADTAQPGEWVDVQPFYGLL